RGWENIGGQSLQDGRPELVAEQGQAEHGDRHGEGNPGSERGDRHDGSADRQSNFAGSIEGKPFANQSAAQPSADKGSETGNCEGYPGEVSDFCHIQVTNIAEVLGQPEDEKKPTSIGEELGQNDSPELPVGEEAGPADALGRRAERAAFRAR